MDYFISQLEIVLPVLGVNAIRVPLAKNADAGDVVGSPLFHLRHAKLGVHAQARQIDGEFTMLEGSIVIRTWHGIGKAKSTKKVYDSYRAQHEQLIDDGAIIAEGDKGRVARPIPFTSPSTAGAVALGRACNGRREWTTSDGSTFGDWESRGVE